MLGTGCLPRKMESGKELYEYGIINLRSPDLKVYVVKIVKVKVSAKEKKALK